jgi:hypothetical protein
LHYYIARLREFFSGEIKYFSEAGEAHQEPMLGAGGRLDQIPNTVLVLSSLIFCHSLMAQGFLTLPENSAIVSAVAGEGVQIYESKPNPAGGFQWSLKGPEADLKGLSGEILGKHGAGPSGP